MKYLPELYNFIGAHEVVLTYILMAMALSLPAPGDPRPLKEKLYSWFHDTAHALANRSRPAPPPPAQP